MEVAPGVHRITVGTTDIPGLFPTNTYLVVGQDAAAFVDSGWNKEPDINARLDYWESLGRPPLKYIIITHRHPDHMGGASAISKASGAVIVAHPKEKEPVESKMEGLYVGKLARDGEVLDLGGIGLELVHAPGHTIGSLVVFLREQKAFFTGDNVLGVGTSVINPDEGDLVLYIQSLEKMLRYQPEVIYPGHGPVVHDPQGKLRELIEHRKQREEQVIAGLRSGKQTVNELLKEIYTELDERLHHLARNQITTHLIKLMREGRVVASASGGETTYRLK